MNANILLLSAGRRVELLQGFQAAAAKLLPESKVYCADSRPDRSAACHLAFESKWLPAVSDEGYTESLIELCNTHDVGLVVPTIDTELLVLASARERFASQGTTLVVSDLPVIETCRDKRKTALWFASRQIRTPQIYLTSDIRFPCFSKFYDGSNSVGAMKMEVAADLTDALRSQPSRMYMELVPADYVEVTIDLYYDRHHELRSIVPRQRLEVRGGEVSKGVTRRDWLYDYLRTNLEKIDGARGCLTLQVFTGSNADDVYAIEVNPRFGGGYPLTLAAGANFPEWLIREYLLNQRIEFFDRWEPNLLMLRYDAKVLVHDYQV